MARGLTSTSCHLHSAPFCSDVWNHSRFIPIICESIYILKVRRTLRTLAPLPEKTRQNNPWWSHFLHRYMHPWRREVLGCPTRCSHCEVRGKYSPNGTPPSSVSFWPDGVMYLYGWHTSITRFYTAFNISKERGTSESQSFQ